MTKYIKRRLVARINGTERTIADFEALQLGHIVIVVAEPGGGKTSLDLLQK